jgi:hypothetical protein
VVGELEQGDRAAEGRRRRDGDAVDRHGMSAAAPVGPPRDRTRRERLVVVAALVVLGAGVVLASTRTFATVRLENVGTPLVVAGSGAVPALAPVGIVLLALAIALTIAGRVARIVLGAVLVLLGLAVVALALPSALDPSAGTRGREISALGVTDVQGSVIAVVGTLWPAFAVVLGALAALLGVVVVVRAPRWPVGGRRYRSDAAPAQVSTDPVDEWDALTRGADPTDRVDPRDL